MELNVGIKHIIDRNAIIIMGAGASYGAKMFLVTSHPGLFWQKNYIKNAG